MKNDKVENTADNDLIDPKELAQAFEHTMHVVRGEYDALPDMMHDTGRLLLKLSRKLSTTQLVLLVGALTLGAVFMVKRLEDALDDDDDNQDQDNRKALNAGSGKGDKQNDSARTSQKSN